MPSPCCKPGRPPWPSARPASCGVFTGGLAATVVVSTTAPGLAGGSTSLAMTAERMTCSGASPAMLSSVVAADALPSRSQKTTRPTTPRTTADARNR